MSKGTYREQMIEAGKRETMIDDRVRLLSVNMDVCDVCGFVHANVSASTWQRAHAEV